MKAVVYLATFIINAAGQFSDTPDVTGKTDLVGNAPMDGSMEHCVYRDDLSEENRDFGWSFPEEEPIVSSLSWH